MDTRRWATWPRRRDIDTPTGINTAIGAVAVVTASMLAACFPAADPALRCGIVAVVIGGFATVTIDPLALLLIVPAEWMIMDGFLVNRLGELTWHGSGDAYRFLVLATAAGAGLALGAADRSVRDLRERRHLGALAMSWASLELKEKKQRA